jgi:hypothetical protein
VQNNPGRIVAAPDGSAVYVSSRPIYELESTLTKISTTTNRAAASIRLFDAPLGLDVSPDGTRVFVTTPSASQSRFLVIDTTLNAIVKTLTIKTAEVSAQSATRVFVSADQSLGGPNSVQLIDITNGTVLASVPLQRDTVRFARDASGANTFIVEQPFFDPSLKRLSPDGSSATTIARGAWRTGAVVPDSCAFEATAVPAAVGPSGGTVVLTLPAPAGCPWTIDLPAMAGLTMTGSLSGTGPATRTLTMTASGVPRFATIGIGRQALPIEQTAPLMQVDFAGGATPSQQPFTIAGWALDLSASPAGASPDSGIDAVHVWAYPPGGAAPVFLGTATLGISRPDVANEFGNRYRLSGFQIGITTLRTGTYRLTFFAHSSRSNSFSNAQEVDVAVVQPSGMVIDTPGALASVTAPFDVAGWAIDPASASGSGVDTVHVWAYPATGGSPMFVGVATMTSRQDVAAFFGNSEFANSGFLLRGAMLPAGTYDLVVFAHSSATNTFNNSKVVRITVR